MSLSVYQIPLNCGHTRACRSKPPPKLGDEVWCILCGGYRVAFGPQWFVQCRTCRYRRRVGLDPQWARTRAIKHLYANGLHHRVSISREDEPNTFTVVTPDTPLPSAGELPF